MVKTNKEGFNHVSLRKHFFNAFVWDVCVSIANLYQTQIKNAAQYITFGEVTE